MASLHFKGKAFVQNYHLTVPYHELIPVKKKSVTAEVSLHDNLIVQGDNLKALKALLPTYAGRVKCIYIDPPYNTGNEHWVYNDNVNSPMMQEWFGKEVDRDDLTRHDKWCCMMMPRLRMLRELLREDGALFVSIDDNEVHRLRALLDIVFGEDRFVANIIWQKKYAVANDHEGVAPMHDHIIVYSKNDSFKRNLLPRTVLMDSQYKYEDKKGIFRVSDYTCNKSSDERPNLYYSIFNDETGKKVWPKKSRVWAYSPEEHQRHIDEELIWWGVDGKAKVPQLKRYRHLLKTGEGYVPSTLWDFEFCGHTDDAKKEVRSIFLDTSIQELATIKPTSMIRRILQIATDKDSIILDSFAGSGTTAHAVLALNKADGGNRKFILVECEDYADTLTAERVRRVIKGVPKASDEALKKGLGGTFSYFELGQAVDVTRLFDRKKLPAYAELAKYVFFTATGREFDAKKLDEKRWFIGETGEHEVYLLYKPDLAWLKGAALTLEAAQALPKPKGKRRMFFAPTKYLDQDHLDLFKIDFAQLPFEIYRMQG